LDLCLPFRASLGAQYFAVFILGAQNQGLYQPHPSFFLVVLEIIRLQIVYIVILLRERLAASAVLTQEKERRPPLIFDNVGDEMPDPEPIGLLYQELGQPGAAPARDVQHVHPVIAGGGQHEDLELHDRPLEWLHVAVLGHVKILLDACIQIPVGGHGMINEAYHDVDLALAADQRRLRKLELPLL
jgi:hypothetical protein